MKPRLRLLTASAAVVSAFLACNLNPQPLPPADEMFAPDGGGFSTDSGPTRSPPTVTADAAANGGADGGADLVDAAPGADAGDGDAADAGDAGVDGSSD